MEHSSGPPLDPIASTTERTNENVPNAVGVPETYPLAESRLRPVGRAPERMENTYGNTPPLAGNEWEYGIPSAPAGGKSQSSERPTEMAQSAKAVCNLDESPTETVKEYPPAEVGTPEATPVAPSRTTPGGRAPAIMEKLT
jgi:hypothetical protein